MKTTPQHFCVAEDCMLLEGGVLYGFTGNIKPDNISGTLRNMKKVEQAIEMLNKLMENDDSEAS